MRAKIFCHRRNKCAQQLNVDIRGGIVACAGRIVYKFRAHAYIDVFAQDKASPRQVGLQLVVTAL